MAKDIKVIFTGDTSRADSAIKSLESSGKQAASILEREFNQLGIKSALSFDNQRLAAEKAYSRIKSSGLATADELKRADIAYKASLKEIDDAQNGVTDGIDGMKLAWSSFAGVLAAAGVGVFVDKLISARVEIDKIKASLGTTFGSGSGEEFAFVSAEAERLGLKLSETAVEYGRLAAASKGTVLEGQATRDIFVGVAEAGTALGLSAEEVSGSLNAVQQMISKGKVSAEELRGQLGERLPGAFGMAAEAMGVTTQELDKMLSSGEVMAADLLPRLAAALHEKFGKAAEDAAKGVNGQLNNLDTAWKTLLVTTGEELPIAETIGLATDGVKLLTKYLDDAAIGFGAMALAAGGQAIIANISAITTAVRALGTSTALATGGISLLAGAAAVAGYEGGKALAEMFDESEKSAAGAMEMMKSHGDTTKRAQFIVEEFEASRKKAADSALKEEEKAQKARDKALDEIRKHNDRILDVKKDRIGKSLELENEYLQKVTAAYDAADKVRDSLSATSASTASQFSDAQNAINPVTEQDDPYLKRLSDLENLEKKEQEINESTTLSAEEKAKKLADLATEAATYNTAVILDGYEVISQLDAQATGRETISRLERESAKALADESAKQEEAFNKYGAAMLDAEDKVKAFKKEIEDLDTLLDLMNNKEIVIPFKVTGAEELLAILGMSSAEYYVTNESDANFIGPTQTVSGLPTSDISTPFGANFHSGTSYVPRSGLYSLARGEQVLSRNESSAAKSGSQSVTIAPVINLSGVSASGAEKTARELARELEPELRKLAGRYRN